MASSIEQDINDKILEIQNFLSGFRNLEPGKEPRLKYIRETVGDAEIYLNGTLRLLLRVRNKLTDLKE